jgi:hypothetical protein
MTKRVNTGAPQRGSRTIGRPPARVEGAGEPPSFPVWSVVGARLPGPLQARGGRNKSSWQLGAMQGAPAAARHARGRARTAGVRALPPPPATAVARPNLARPRGENVGSRAATMKYMRAPLAAAACGGCAVYCKGVHRSRGQRIQKASAARNKRGSQGRAHSLRALPRRAWALRPRGRERCL